MLKFNSNLIWQMHKKDFDLNTSYVKVQWWNPVSILFLKFDLNTSYVKVQCQPIYKEITLVEAFKYILC